MSTPPPVQSWETDFDHTHPDYGQDAPAIWDELRETCPVAHTERFGGAWLPVRHEDIRAIAHDYENYTSASVIVGDPPDVPPPMGVAPPITSDPPFHKIARRLLLPAFAPRPIQALAPFTRSYCNELLDRLIADGPEADAAVEYAQEIPVRIIAHMLGLPAEDGDLFRFFIRNLVETAGVDIRTEDDISFQDYLGVKIAEHRANPRSDEDGDLIDYLINADIGGMPLADEHVFGTVALLLVAGVDTTWSAIGSALWHLAQHPEDRKRWIDDPEVRPFAVEEFLRLYAPVTMARMAATDHELGGCPVKQDDWVLLPFPAANRDPKEFEQAGEYVIDRERNRHSAFGLGIHRCLGSNLARLELSIAIECWMDRIGDFELIDPETVRWSSGQIRGPRELPVRIL